MDFPSCFREFSRGCDVGNPCACGPPSPLLLYKDSNNSVLTVVFDSAAFSFDVCDVSHHGHVRCDVPNLNIARIEFKILTIGILDLRNLLSLVYDLAPRVDLDEAI